MSPTRVSVSRRETARRHRRLAARRRLPEDGETPLERLAGFVTATSTLGGLLVLVLVLVALLM